MRLVFIMDPVSTVLVDADTTFALMHEAHQRGHHVDFCLVRDVGLDRGEAIATVQRATTQRDSTAPITLGERTSLALRDVDVVFIRKDPPFDSEYLWLTQILSTLDGGPLVMNDPRGIQAANEKLYATHFPDLMPRTIVTADATRIRAFLADIATAGIIKPVDGHGGAGIFRIALDDGNLNAAIETVTRQGSRVAMVQEFLPEVTTGDKRILLLDGEPLGAILRVPQGGDVRSNIHVGGKVVGAALDDTDRHIVERMRDRLRDDGLWFVGLDVIGGRLTEVNVTSPTGIQQMSRLDGTSHEARVIDWIEQRTKAS